MKTIRAIEILTGNIAKAYKLNDIIKWKQRMIGEFKKLKLTFVLINEDTSIKYKKDLSVEYFEENGQKYTIEEYILKFHNRLL